ncbi:MAG TPA: cytidyltransferase-related domain protein [Clostridia bacterium]|nr:cytidyltransferase-related domain protein [Clostridia bacterium]
MAELFARQIGAHLFQALIDKRFLNKLSMSAPSAAILFERVDWEQALSALLPLQRRITCKEVFGVARPLLECLAPEPPQGWLNCAYQVANTMQFPQGEAEQNSQQRDGALCYLRILQQLLEEERAILPFSSQYDFAFCTEEELGGSASADEYRRFCEWFKEDFVYELLRLSHETTPYRTLEHIAGVHHVAMTSARAFYAGGGLVDLPLLSAAAAAHDIGKFGCKAGERVPYLHYHYTDIWCARRGLYDIGRIAANHSVWDLEIENLSSESLLLVYADFRVKQSRDEDGREIAQIFSLADSFDVILRKLDNVDATKRRRYQFVYAKLHDFEEYMRSFGVDTTLAQSFVQPATAKDAALMSVDEAVAALRHRAVDHNIRLMHRLGHGQLFGNILEAARSEKTPDRIRAYVSVFEEYFTYWSTAQKEQTLSFLYELLMYPDGDIRRQAASLIGRILAGFHSGYRKEQPIGCEPASGDARHYELWHDYFNLLIYPDSRLTPQQVSKIRYTAKLAVDALLDSCSEADATVFANELFRHYDTPEQVEPDAAFALLDTVVNLPAAFCGTAESEKLARFAMWWLKNGEKPQKAAALRLFRHLLYVLPQQAPLREEIARAAQEADCEGSTPLMFLQAQLGRMLGYVTGKQDDFLSRQAAVSNIFLDNLKTATPWIMKAVGVEYLLDLIEQGNHTNILHIATHFSNLIKVGENVVVRRMAGTSLLAMAFELTPERRNEIAVELSKALETGQSEPSKYIPEYLGRFALWLPPRELDELIDQMENLLCAVNSIAVNSALDTVGAIMAGYAIYGTRFEQDIDTLTTRRSRLAGLLLKGLASYREPVRQETLRILGEELFASKVMAYADKAALFILVAKKLMCLISENEERELTFFYTAAALSHIYRFLVLYKIEDGPFCFSAPERVAFFPGTFDPFSLSHKGIVQSIRDMGFEVYLAIDEFSWSKKAQPALVRRQIVNMSVADTFNVYLFPHDLPVNLANPSDLNRLRSVFAGRELYLAVGSDVVANASSYKAAAVPGCVQEMNHIVFRRVSSADGPETEADLRCIQGKVLQLQLPPYLEDISSTRIRENIDLGRDISNLIDPTVQDYIYRNSLYLREPQYKRLYHAGYLDFSLTEHPDDTQRVELLAAVFPGKDRPPRFDLRDDVIILRDTENNERILGYLTMRIVSAINLYDALLDARLTNYVRAHTAGRILLLTGLHLIRNPNTSYNIGQLLLTEALSRAMAEDCGYAVYYPTSREHDSAVIDLLRRQGFVVAEVGGDRPLLLVDMRSPVVLIQNLATTLKEPFSSSTNVLDAIRESHIRMQEALTGLYPGTLILSLNAEVIYHRLVRKIVEANHVPAEPTIPRALGKKMCVPFGKILRGNAIPNTVTKTIHTDKVFAQDLRSFTIEAFPGYAPLESQLRTIKSFCRPAILVDDLLHSGNRINALSPLLGHEDIPIDRVLVGVMSGKGRDLMRTKGMKADCVYFVPNLRAWFVESTMYPFIGGDTVGHDEPSVPGLTPAINLVLPYAFPRFYKECGREAVFKFSQVCIENSRDIIKVLESEFRGRFARNLTLSRLSEAVILPLSPDKGSCLYYDPNLPASTYLDNDLKMLLRMRDVLE